MKWARTLAMLSLVLIPAMPAWAQGETTRPAMTTFLGDTGMWFVPTGEVLPTGKPSVSVQRTEFDYRQGNTNLSFFPITGAVGAGPLELFGSLRMITRIDRDTSPLLFAGPNNEAGGLVNEFPTVNNSFTGNQLGDLYVGVKLNVLSQRRNQPVALALRGVAKFPTGDKADGVSTGEYDGIVDAVLSREAGGVEWSGYGGIVLRGDPPNISISDSMRWGGGLAFPTRRTVRLTTELYGDMPFDHAVTATAGAVVGADNSLSPAISNVDNEVSAAFGVTYQHPSGVLLGAALTYRFDLAQKDPASGANSSTSKDALGLQFRIGFHPGVRTYVPPPPAVAAVEPPPPAPVVAAAPPPPPAPVANRGPMVKAVCDPCTVESGGVVNLRAESSDPDGDTLTYRWTTTGGTLADTRAMATTWRAETAPGLVTFSVTVEDGRGGTASDRVTVQVSGGEAVEFEDVHFDFDSYTLRADALSTLEPALAALNNSPRMRIQIEGHTCSIGTVEYNLALGDRRASAVREYLIKRGVSAERLTTVSYGEERPKYDNSQEETRKLNRRAVLVVKVTESDTN